MGRNRTPEERFENSLWDLNRTINNVCNTKDERKRMKERAIRYFQHSLRDMEEDDE